MVTRQPHRYSGRRNAWRWLAIGVLLVTLATCAFVACQFDDGEPDRAIWCDRSSICPTPRPEHTP